MSIEMITKSTITGHKIIRGSLHLLVLPNEWSLKKIIVNSDFSVIGIRADSRFKMSDVCTTFFEKIDRPIFIHWLYFVLFKYDINHNYWKCQDWFFGMREPERYLMRTLNYGVVFRYDHFEFVTMRDNLSTMKNVSSFSFPLTTTEYLLFVDIFDNEYVKRKIRWINKLPTKYPKREKGFHDGAKMLVEKITTLRSLGEPLLIVNKKN